MNNKPDVITAYITEPDIQIRVRELGTEISNDYAGKELTIICVLKGAFMFCADLVRHIKNVKYNVEFVQLSSYGKATVSSGRVDFIKIVEHLPNTHVLIVEDIIDTGNTIKHFLETLKTFDTQSVKVCTLLDKPSRREDQRVQADYKGFTIPNVFVVGYGLDKAEQHRGLRFIGKIEETGIGRILSPIKNFATHGQAQAARSIHRFAERIKKATESLMGVYK